MNKPRIRVAMRKTDQVARIMQLQYLRVVDRYAGLQFVRYQHKTHHWELGEYQQDGTYTVRPLALIGPLQGNFGIFHWDLRTLPQVQHDMEHETGR